jgi:outer membrane protein OmpA-like peptidoglycan-associated protein
MDSSWLARRCDSCQPPQPCHKPGCPPPCINCPQIRHPLPGCHPGDIIINNNIGNTAGQGTSGTVPQEPVPQQEQPAPSPAPAKPKVDDLSAYADRILFEVDRWDLRDESFYYLDRIADIMNASPDTRYFIDGHTDDTYTETHNLELSKNRAYAVKDYLIMKGIDPSRLEIRFFGESRPKYSNSTPDSRLKNRRVEIHPIPAGISMVSVEPASSAQTTFYTIQLMAVSDEEALRQNDLMYMDGVRAYQGPDGLIRIVAGMFSSKEEAAFQLGYYRRSGYKDAWITTIK